MALTKEQIERVRAKVGLSSNTPQQDNNINVDNNINKEVNVNEERIRRLKRIVGNIQTKPLNNISNTENNIEEPINPNMKTAPFKTLVKSGSKAIGDIANAFIHPIDTAKGLGKVIIGESQLGAQKIHDKLFNKKSTVNLPEMDMARSVNKYALDRYGGWEQAKKTMMEDPVGFAIDLSGFLGGIGGAVSKAGKLGEISKIGTISKLSKASKLGKIGKVISKAGRVVDPISGVFKGTNKVLGAVKNKLPSRYKIGEVLTGIPKKVAKDYVKGFKETPKNMLELEKQIKISPKEPFKVKTESIANSLNTMKKTAKNTYSKAKEIIINSNKYKDTKFNIKKGLNKINNTLNKHGLNINKENGVFNLGVKDNINPFSIKEQLDINRIVETLQHDSVTAHDLINLDTLVKDLFDKYARQDNKKMVAVLADLTNDVSKYIDKQLPEIDKANKLYTNYYNALKNSGNKVINATGEIKPSAESFISNSVNYNKGTLREQIKSLETAIGVNILDDVGKIKNIEKLIQHVPSTVRNRMMDFLRGGLGVTVITGGDIQSRILAGTSVLLASLVSSPNMYKKFLQWTAKPKGTVMPLDLKKFLNPMLIKATSILGRENKLQNSKSK